MIELKGKHNSAKIFTDLVDEASIAQISALLDQEFTENLRIRMMPDVHAGAEADVLQSLQGLDGVFVVGFQIVAFPVRATAERAAPAPPADARPEGPAPGG